MIEPAVEPILVDLLTAELEQIAKRRPAIPILGNVQLARRLAKSRRNQHGRHLRPRDTLLASRKQPLARRLKTDAAPQRQRQIHIAKPTRAFDPNALQAHRRRQIAAAVIEQRRLLRRADQPARQRPRLNPAVLVKLAKMRHRLLNDATPDANAPHQTPITVDLPILLANRMAQVHAPSEPGSQRKKIPKVVTTRSNWLRAPANLLIQLGPPHAKLLKLASNCASWANASDRFAQIWSFEEASANR